MSNLANFAKKQAISNRSTESHFKLEDGSRIGVIGGGPAGSFFSYFTLDMAERMGTNIKVDIYEPRDFFSPSPKGCNMCGGIISETLVQMLATEGITLPPQIIQRGIDSYALHMDKGSVAIETPLQEKRIGAVHRGCGPRDAKETKWGSFDGYLQILAIEKGANVIQSKVDDILFENGRPQVICKESEPKSYDLITVAVGINAPLLKIFPKLDFGYQPPAKTKTFIREFYLGEEMISEYLGSSMHIFLLDIPGLEFAAFIPKGDYVTFCMLGQKMDNNLLDKFLHAPEVKAKMPPTVYNQLISCHCNPYINIKGVTKPFADRIVFIGDAGVTRLYKDGIGAAYRTAKSAATTVIFEGVSKNDFKKFFWPACKHINFDNLIGKFVFSFNTFNQKFAFARLAILEMVREEQKNKQKQQYMSTILWDMFTGSATYREIFLLTLHPVFLYRYIKAIIKSVIPIFRNNHKDTE
jgi:flavin-dependent dehydrogenase